VSNERYKRYSREYKLEAVRRTFESGKTIAGVARELGLSTARLYKWRKEAEVKGDRAFPGIGQRDPNNELTRLRRENTRLRMERDILKKSLVFFARDEKIDSDSSENKERNTP